MVDLIICDVRLQGMSETDLFNKIQDTLPEIPFILITAFGFTENAMEAVKKGLSLF
ncbi:MAG: response regulator [Smithellaceae bacterium]|nr:response regulator [Smithellaceae bacterium]